VRLALGLFLARLYVWFRKDELNQLYNQRVTVGASPDIYWSSSEFDADEVWFHGFKDNLQSRFFYSHSNPMICSW
jgi:hypothetical protein